MSVTAQNLFLTNPRSHHLCFYSNQIHNKTPIFTLSISPKHLKNPLHFKFLGKKFSNPKIDSFRTTLKWPLRVIQSEGAVQKEGLNKKINLDAFLSIAEVLCLAPSAVLSIGFAVNWVVSKKSFQELVVTRVFVWQFVLLFGAVFIDALIRRRQWSRICRDSIKSNGSSFNLLERIEKLEEDLRSSATIIRVLSRQLEKLGIRFRVTRKALKEPITETAVLAQKNSEATRALAAQEDILEKELGEIQKVLLAMQEQQQKQLELILAIMKAGKPREIKREFVAEEVTNKVNSVTENKAAKKMESQIKIEDKHDIERV
ncbi:hypothetical protein BVC80_9061g42 [Macleaya cordata]|uniref:Transmembrane protein n=1 Tax=Macleaya cordata TaxID=56857 RepID=A0A200PN21_MACCD|nr:hypothetical protein BVC80_9061g42 [Macleaya cordata]